jgi:hypothetical protein
MPDFLLPGLALSLITTLPLAWKWTLGIRRTAVAVAALSAVTAVLIEITPFFQDAGDADGTLLKAGANWVLTLAAAFALLGRRGNSFRSQSRRRPASRAGSSSARAACRRGRSWSRPAGLHRATPARTALPHRRD